VSNPFVRALIRFWYVLVLGLAAALVAGVLVVDSISLGVPPKLHPRAKPNYQAQAEMLVDTKRSQFFATARTEQQQQGYHFERTQYRDSKGVTHSKLVQVPNGIKNITVTPEFKTLTFYANLYPTLAKSDDVMRVRRRLYPFLPKNGTVEVQALGAGSASGGRLRTSPLPIDVVVATAKTPVGAMQLAQATATAFRTYVNEQAKGSGDKNPVTIRLLSLPDKAVNTTSSASTLAGLVAVVVFALFAGLALLLDRWFPRRRTVSASGMQRDLDDEDALLEEELQRLRETTRAQ
jgi:hypothetical protein